jgi:UvrD/REP helicase N-terminal domain
MEKKMKFLLLDHGAASQIVSKHFLQSIEFEQGLLLSDFLINRKTIDKITQYIFVKEKNNGIYFTSEKKYINQCVVFDLEKCDPFNGKTPEEALMIFQKVLRFCIRYWENMGIGSCERIIPDSTKAVVFPFPIFTKSSFRISIERRPDAQRMEKRGGNHLLIYKAGYDEGGGAKEEADIFQFRKALEGLKDIYDIKFPVSKEKQGEEKTFHLNVVELDSLERPMISSQLGLNNWMTLLTEQQKKFVITPITEAERIQGPAGTGKTLCLVLKSINTITEYKKSDREIHLLFITHSVATKKNIEDIFCQNLENCSNYFDKMQSLQSVTITTLQEWCINHLKSQLGEAEYLDRDAQESKDLQILYINDSIQEAFEHDYDSYRPILSNEFAKFLEQEDRWALAEMVQHEIGVVIKGRADEDLDKYKSLPPLKYGLPVKNTSDLGFVFSIYKRYQDKLRKINQFDSDDIILTAIGQLKTPIWRRRRQTDGFDAIIIDETHLFNINELSIFHHLLKSNCENNIVFSQDLTQAIGDRGLSYKGIYDALLVTEKEKEAIDTINFRTIFRCSPDIINLAFHVVSSGATLFTNFENPLDHSITSFTEDEERKCIAPHYYSFVDDVMMIQGAFKLADKLVDTMKIKKSELVFVTFSNILLAEMERYVREQHKPVEILKQRGDIKVVKQAEKGGRFVLGGAEYVGGLEFCAAILVGVDDGRVPPIDFSATHESSHFLKYATHNKLYVAITRAKYGIALLGVKSRGPSNLLNSAISSGVLALDPTGKGD